MTRTGERMLWTGVLTALILQGCDRGHSTGANRIDPRIDKPVRIQKASGELSLRLRTYLAAVALENPGDTKLFLSKNCNRDFLTDYGVLAKAGWKYSEDRSRLLGQKVSQDGCHAVVTAALLYEGGGRISLYHNDFFWVLEDGEWRYLSMHQACRLTGDDRRLNSEDYVRGRTAPEHTRALVDAVAQANPALVRLHVALGADVNGKAESSSGDYRSATALTAAVRAGTEMMTRMLLDCGADIDGLGLDGLTPLMVAVRQGAEPLVGLLLENGADVNAGMAGYPMDGNTLVPMAQDGTRLANAGTTALMIAVKKEQVSLVPLLLDAGADVNAKTADDWTALMSAVDKGHEQMARVLIERGADVNAKDENGVSLLAQAMFEMGFEDRFDRYHKIAKMLIEKGADPNGLAIGMLNGGPMTLLQDAILSKWDDIARLLIEKGAVIPKE